MPEQIIASSNPALQQSVTATTTAATPTAQHAEAAPPQTESTVQISPAARQQLGSEQSASNATDSPASLSGEVSASEAPQTADVAALANTQSHAPAQAPDDGERELGSLINQYA